MCICVTIHWCIIDFRFSKLLENILNFIFLLWINNLFEDIGLNLILLRCLNGEFIWLRLRGVLGWGLFVDIVESAISVGWVEQRLLGRLLGTLVGDEDGVLLGVVDLGLASSLFWPFLAEGWLGI
jgi:hypothetical protein